MKIYQPKDYKGSNLVSEKELEAKKFVTETTIEALKDDLSVCQDYQSDSSHAQSGLAVAQAIADRVTTDEFTQHKTDTEIHLVEGEKEELLAKVSQEELESAKQELLNEITSRVETALRYKGSKKTKADLPEEENEIGDFYNVEETGANYAWTGQEWDKLSEDISGLAKKTDLAEHESKTDLHVNPSEKAEWSGKATQEYVDQEVGKIETRVAALEQAPVDETFSEESTNPQSGKAVADAIKNLATRDEVASKAENATLIAHTGNTSEHVSEGDRTKWNDTYSTTEIDNKLNDKVDQTVFEGLSNRVETLENEKITVDTAFNTDTDNPLSGRAINQGIEDRLTSFCNGELTEKLNVKADESIVSQLQENLSDLEALALKEASTFEYTPTVNLNWGNNLAASCNYFQVHTRYLKPGKINTVTIMGKGTSYATTQAYLTLFTSPDGTTWTKLATSSNQATITEAQSGVFQFAQQELKPDLHVRFVFTASTDAITDTGDSTIMGVGGMQAASDDLISKVHGAGADSAYLAHIAISYTPATTASIKDHLMDLTTHLLGNERQILVSFMQGYNGTATVKDMTNDLTQLKAKVQELESLKQQFQEIQAKLAEQSN